MNLPGIDVALISKNNIPEYKYNLDYGNKEIVFPENVDIDNFFTLPLKLGEFEGTLEDLFDFYGTNKLPIESMTKEKIKDMLDKKNCKISEYHTQEIVDACNCSQKFRFGATCEYQCEKLKKGLVGTFQFGCIGDGYHTAKELKESCCNSCKKGLKRYIKKEEDQYYLRYYLIVEEKATRRECKKTLLKEFEKKEVCSEYYKWKTLKSKKFKTKVNNKNFKNNIDVNIEITKDDLGGGFLVSYDYKVFFNNKVVCEGNIGREMFIATHIIKIKLTDNSTNVSREIYKHTAIFEPTNDTSSCESHMEVIGGETTKKYCIEPVEELVEDKTCLENNNKSLLKDSNNITVIYRRTDCEKYKIVYKRTK